MIRVATADQVEAAIKHYGPRRAAAALRAHGLMAPIAGASGIAIDSSTPALASNASGTTCTSNTFSPPAGSLLVIALPSTYGNTISSITDSLGTHLTYRKLVSGLLDEDCEIWVADCPSAQTNMTVTATMSATQPAGVSAFGPIVLTGAAAAASQTGAVNSNPQYSGAPSCGVTTTANGSLVIGVAVVQSTTTSPVPSTGQTTTFASQTLVDSINGAYVWCQTTTSPTTSSGTLVTIGVTSSTTGDHGIVVAEILAASGGGGGSPPGPPPRVYGQAVNRAAFY